MAKQFLLLSLNEYGDLESLVPGQEVRLNVVAQVSDMNDKDITLRLKSLHVASRQKLSVQEVLMRKQLARQTSIDRKTSPVQHVP